MTQYVDTDIYENPSLVRSACDKLSTYAGTNTFLNDVKAKLLQYGSLTVPQTRAVLNALERETTNTDHQSETQPAMRDGTYTVVFDPSGETYVTLRLNTPKDGTFKGKQIAAYLNGPDNNYNYQGFAFVSGHNFNAWRKFNDADTIKMQKLALVMLLNSDDPSLFGYEYSLKSGRCYICHRTLTVPASLYRGMGPICAANNGETD